MKRRAERNREHEEIREERKKLTDFIFKEALNRDGIQTNIDEDTFTQ